MGAAGNREAMSAGKYAPQRRYRASNTASGKCYRCGKPVIIKANGKPGRMCEEHTNAERERSRKRQGFKGRKLITRKTTNS